MAPSRKITKGSVSFRREHSPDRITMIEDGYPKSEHVGVQPRRQQGGPSSVPEHRSGQIPYPGRRCATNNSSYAHEIRHGSMSHNQNISDAESIEESEGLATPRRENLTSNPSRRETDTQYRTSYHSNDLPYEPEIPSSSPHCGSARKDSNHNTAKSIKPVSNVVLEHRNSQKPNKVRPPHLSVHMVLQWRASIKAGGFLSKKKEQVLPFSHLLGALKGEIT